MFQVSLLPVSVEVELVEFHSLLFLQTGHLKREALSHNDEYDYDEYDDGHNDEYDYDDGHNDERDHDDDDDSPVSQLTSQYSHE